MTGPKFRNPRYLLNQQYKNASNLNARIRLHELFSLNPYGWFLWLFDQMEINEPAKILELGCGSGTIWEKNRDRIPSGWEIFLTDFSLGMLQEARMVVSAEERDKHKQFQFEVVDAQDIPFKRESFDAILAYFVLFFVPQLKQSLGEIQRVLKPGGVLYAATFGPAHMKEIHEMAARFGFGSTFKAWSEIFNLENGEGSLREFFEDIRINRYEDALEIKDLEPLVDYAKSTSQGAAALKGTKLELFREYVEEILEMDGVIYVQKDSGLFTAKKAEV